DEHSRQYQVLSDWHNNGICPRRVGCHNEQHERERYDLRRRGDLHDAHERRIWLGFSGQPDARSAQVEMSGVEAASPKGAASTSSRSAAPIATRGCRRGSFCAIKSVSSALKRRCGFRAIFTACITPPTPQYVLATS